MYNGLGSKETKEKGDYSWGALEEATAGWGMGTPAPASIPSPNGSGVGSPLRAFFVGAEGRGAGVGAPSMEDS